MQGQTSHKPTLGEDSPVMFALSQVNPHVKDTFTRIKDFCLKTLLLVSMCCERYCTLLPSQVNGAAVSAECVAGSAGVQGKTVKGMHAIAI